MRIALFSLLPAALLALGIDASAGDMDRRSDGLAPITKAEWTLDTAAHLLRRAGFGGTLAEISALHAKGPASAVDSLLDWKGKSDDNVPRIRIAITSRPGREEYMGKTREQRQEMSRAHRRDDYGQIAAVREWWLQSMIATAHPARERLVLFWHGHFTSGYRDVRNSYHMYIQNTQFRRHAAGNFKELLHDISKDPAMLEYLDNNRNRKGQPNENYAREVMELFTLGEGHYTENDIKEAARALTGWTFVGNRFHFERRQHDEGEKTILGRTGNFDGTQFLDILLSQPQAYRHIAGRLFRYFAHRRPSDSDIDGLARTLARSDWELKPALRQLFLSREFYSKRSMRTKIKAPVEMIVGLFRSLRMEADAAMGLSFQASSLGQELMGPPNVKGWPGGREWITTSMLLNRYNICGALVGVPEDKMRTMRTQRYRGIGGYRIWGQSSFISGCHNAEWCFMIAPIVENDAPKLTEEGMPIVRMWFLNRSEWQIVDTWDVAGLRGSGSHDVLAKGALVPEKFVPVELVTLPPLYANPVFRVPVPLRLAYNKAAIAIGVARGALNTFADRRAL